MQRAKRDRPGLWVLWVGVAIADMRSKVGGPAVVGFALGVLLTLSALHSFRTAAIVSGPSRTSHASSTNRHNRMPRRKAGVLADPMHVMVWLRFLRVQALVTLRASPYSCCAPWVNAEGWHILLIH